MHRLITATVSAMAIFALSAGCDSDEGGETGQGGAATTTQTGTAGSGGQGALGGGGDGGATGGGGAGGANTCVDTSVDEPNDDPADAVNLLVVTDDDPAVWPEFDGVIDGTADVDWYTFLGTDEPAAYVDPELTFDDTGFGLTLCAYFWCTHPGAWGPPEIGSGSGGGPAHVCPPGSSEATVDLSHIDFGGVDMGLAPGCCTDAGEGTLHLGEDLLHTFWTPFSCTGLTDDMKVFISVAAPHGWPENTCEPYDVSYHY